ncbi:hypothetical protein F5Y18DRAFT_35599 [Xylariaceae sp. FL1019]|nr:hypothetical protein F5Y18DRAFT_35599 [Xylariaceae sp. FL1019]
MAMWPFRRRGTKRRTRTAPLDSSNAKAPYGFQARGEPRTDAQPASAARGRDMPEGLQNNSRRRTRAYSFSPGRQDSLGVNKLKKQSGPPPTSQTRYGHGQGSMSYDDIAMRVPTLHPTNSRNKRRGQPLPRKKSSKRRKEDHDREAEIRAMSQFMPVRPATDTWTSGRPMRRESRRLRGGDPSSDISLPLPESIHSAMSSDSEQISWKVSAIDALAPRPTLRYASNPLSDSATSSGPVRAQSTRKRISDRAGLPDATLRDRRRIHDLADDFDATDLRELMERDKRRRERKREKEQERMERRLARRAEKQRAEEAAAIRNGSTPPANMERGVMGREMPVSSHAQRTSAIVTSTRRRSPSDSSRRQSKTSLRSNDPPNRDKTPSPLDEFHRTDSIPREVPSPVEPTAPLSEPEVEDTPSRRSSSSKIFNLIRPKKSRSISPRQSGPAASSEIILHPSVSLRHEDAESISRTSDSRASRPWLSLFKWRKNRRSSGPSSFSNTSRDSMLGSQPTLPINYVASRKVSSGVPKRTMSRFREDLPELPLSPPDSRMASPEIDPIQTEPLPAIQDDVVMRYDTPTEAMRVTPSSMHRDELQASPAPHSMSLASIDSEASWLSGRISRQRTSSGMRTSLPYPPRTVSALSGGSEAQASDHTDDDIIADDEYLKSVVPSRLQRNSTGEARPSSDEDEAESSPTWGEKWGEVGQVPLMHHRETMKSQEGLLQSFDSDDKELSNSKDSDDDGEGQTPGEPQRATSIHFGKGHVRNFSAGSAKLLELSPRPSGEQRRGAIERGAQ